MNTDFTVQDHCMFQRSERCSKCQVGSHMRLSGTAPDHHTWDFQGQFLTHRGIHLFRLMRVTSLKSTHIKPTLSVNPSSSTTGREIKTNTTHHSSKQILKESFMQLFESPPLTVYLSFGVIVKWSFDNSTSHTEVAVQESKGRSQIFLFLLDKTKFPQTRLQRAKVFANIVNAFSYLKGNVYFTSKIFRLNYLKAKSASKIPWSPFLSQTLKTYQLV